MQTKNFVIFIKCLQHDVFSPVFLKMLCSRRLICYKTVVFELIMANELDSFGHSLAVCTYLFGPTMRGCFFSAATANVNFYFQYVEKDAIQNRNGITHTMFIATTYTMWTCMWLRLNAVHLYRASGNILLLFVGRCAIIASQWEGNVEKKDWWRKSERQTERVRWSATTALWTNPTKLKEGNEPKMKSLIKWDG